MAESENNNDNYYNTHSYKTMEFVPDHIKTKTMCKDAVKKLLFVIIHVLDRYKTQEMCDKVVLRKWWNIEVYS